MKRVENQWITTPDFGDEIPIHLTVSFMLSD